MKIKKVICVFLSICIMGMLSGCLAQKPDNTKEPVSTKNAFSFIQVMVGDSNLEQWNENNSVTSVLWQKLRLSDECNEKYPALSKAFDKYNEQSLVEAKALMYEFAPLAQEIEVDGFNPTYYGSEAKIYMQRADNSIVSFLESVYQYTGGVHPEYFVKGKSYNPQTGEELLLTDVLNDISSLPTLLEKKITEKYSYVTFYDLADTFSKYKADEFTWTMDYQGITFWFSPYEIAAYAVGTLSARVWFDEADIFNEAYTTSPENYVITLPVGHDMDFDMIPGDDKKDTICAETVMDDYGSYYMLSVSVNGETALDEINYAYDFDVYLAHIGDKNYIYSDSFSDNDYHMFCTWDLNGAAPKMTDELYGTEVDYEYIEEGFEDGTVYKKVFNNPQSLKLETRFEILGTRGATASYKLGENGRIEMTDEAYTFNYGHSVKTSIPLKAYLLPEMNEIEIPAGENLTPCQTDGKTFVDLQTEEGNMVRLSIDVSSWPRLVNGMMEDECFEELLYAG